MVPSQIRWPLSHNRNSSPTVLMSPPWSAKKGPFLGMGWELHSAQAQEDLTRSLYLGLVPHCECNRYCTHLPTCLLYLFMVSSLKLERTCALFFSVPVVPVQGLAPNQKADSEPLYCPYLNALKYMLACTHTHMPIYTHCFLFSNFKNHIIGLLLLGRWNRHTYPYYFH